MDSFQFCYRQLYHLEADLSLAYSIAARTMSNAQSKFVKQVLVEEGEYDRLRQNHYRNYSPQIRAMDKLQEFIFETMMRKDLDPQQKIDLCSGPRQRFNQLREETNTLNGESTATGPAAPKVDQPKVELTDAKAKTEPTANAKQEPTVIQNEAVKVVQPQKADKLMDLIGNNPNIIRRNDENEMEINGRAVPGTNFDELYANLFSPHGTQHLPGMAELIGALRQLNVESKDIVSHPIQAAYESATPRSGPLRHYEKAIPKAVRPKPKPKSKRRSTSAFEIEETVPPKHETRATTKYNMPRKRLSAVSKTEQSGTGLKIPRILYVY